jgi:hypothetical protein
MNRTRNNWEPRRAASVFAGAYLLLFAATAQSLPAATRVALLMTEPPSVNGPLLSLAEAKISSLPDIVLVERGEIQRLLFEQKLSLNSFTDPENAVQTGKLLGADILGVVEIDPETKIVLGLIVFDARSGVQLWNVALPKEIEKAAATIANSMQQAVAKTLQKGRARRVVSLITTRNADMPRSMDRFCEAVGVLFERELARNPVVLVLDRRHLDELNHEREFPTAPLTNSLLASVTLVSIDVHRGEKGNGLKANATLRDLKGKAKKRIAVSIPTQDAAKLAEALVTRVGRSLGAKLNAAKLNPVLQRLEAQRFLREAQARVSHHEIEAAWRSTEAAHALDPNDVIIENLLNECLLDEAVHLLGVEPTNLSYRSLSPQPDYKALYGNDRQPSQDEMLQALEFGMRSLEFRETQFRNVLGSGDTARMQEEELRAGHLSLSSVDSMIHFVDAIYWRCGGSTDAKVREQYGQFCQQFLRLECNRVESWAQLAKEDPKAFRQFTQVLMDVVASFQRTALRYVVPKPDEFLARLDRFLHLWLEAANAHPPTSDCQGLITDFCYRLRNWTLSPVSPLIQLRPNDSIQPQHLEMLRPFADAMVASPSHMISAEGKTLRNFIDAPPKHEKGLQPSEQAQAWQQDAVPHPMEGTNWTAAPWDMPVRLLDAAELPQIEGFCSSVVTKDAVYTFGVKRRGSTDPSVREIYAQAAAEKWSEKRLLDTLQAGTAHEIDVQLIRVPLNGGKPAIVNQASFATSRLYVRQAQVSGTTIWAQIDLDYPEIGANAPSHPPRTLYEFPTDGRPAIRIDDQLDLLDRNFQSFGVVGNKLYLGANGFIYLCDLASKRVDILASSRRTDKKSELEGGQSFLTPLMLLDPPRNRIIIVTWPIERTTVPRSFSGDVWSLDYKSGKFTKLLASKLEFQIQHMELVDQDTVLFSAESGGLFAIDLRSDKLIDLHQPGRPCYFQCVHEWHMGPHLIHKGCLWSTRAFGRINLATNQREYFQPIIPTHWKASFEPDFLPGLGSWRIEGRHVAKEIESGCLAAVENGNKLLFGTSFELWLLPLR